ncbi:hypothetical protein Vadar_027987 [Vaccinium darrowii]|uniref:Uncharacterized protein n=1 Tax=Vaccinium darrowii TaxID=229202 RepID=A0ACB7X4A9_9ERIC|nr:hypothetical protein Vadar_027987 [Vaccinium darrowii]
MGMKYGPSDLIALADLVHAPREDAESGQENGDGAGALVRDPPGKPDRSEPARRRAVLKNRHVLHARHARFVPYRSLRHVLPLDLGISLFAVWLVCTVATGMCERDRIWFGNGPEEECGCRGGYGVEGFDGIEAANWEGTRVI